MYNKKCEDLSNNLGKSLARLRFQNYAIRRYNTDSEKSPLTKKKRLTKNVRKKSPCPFKDGSIDKKLLHEGSIYSRICGYICDTPSKNLYLCRRHFMRYDHSPHKFKTDKDVQEHVHYINMRRRTKHWLNANENSKRKKILPIPIQLNAKHRGRHSKNK